MIALAALMLLALAPVLSSPAWAEQDAACAQDYSRPTQDGKYVFVMLAREEVSRDNPASCVRSDDSLRARFAASGLYHAAGPATPLWTVDWYASATTASQDGRHLVRWAPLIPEGDFSATALTFYDMGHEIAAYQVDRLVSFPFMLPVIDGHFTWVHDFSLDEETGRLTFATELGEHYIFDITNGRALSNWVPPVPRYFFAVGALLTLLASIPVLIAAARQRAIVPPATPALRRKAG